MAQTIKLKRSATAGGAPTTSQLELGEVAINTYDGKMYIKKSVSGTESIVEISGGGDSGTGIIDEFLYTATAGQTAFSGNDDNSDFLSYVTGAIQVFLNGILLDPETDYTATNGALITLVSAAVVNDYLQIFSFKKKISDGNVTVDSFSGNNSTTAFTLSIDPGDENNTRVFVDGVYQSKANYTVSGTTLTFSTAPPSGTAIEVESGNRSVTLPTTENLDFPDNVKLRLGTSQDLEIYHDASDSLINDNGTGSLKLQTGGSTKLEVTSTGVDVTGNIGVSGTVDGVDIAARDAVLTSTTTTAGAALPKAGGAMTGAITTNSTFDGRDVAADGTKLDTIETSATADQTQSEINALGITATGLSGTPAISVANITTTGELRGPASLVIDPAGIGDNTGTVVIKGNLQVDGATTTINSTTLTVDDLNLTLASGAANGTAADGAGITIDGASATLTYQSTGDNWAFNKNLDVTGNIAVSGTVDGVDIAARDAVLTSTTTTAGAALPKAGGTMTGDLILGDSIKLELGAGTGGDLQLYHDGSHSYVTNTYASGALKLVSDDFRIENASNRNQLKTGVSGAVQLFFDDGSATGLRLGTTATGVDVTGSIVVSGTVDGVDIAARDGVLTSTTTTAGAALPKAGGTMTGNLRVDHSDQYYVGIKIRNSHSSVQSDWNVGGSGGTSGWGATNGNFIIRDDTTNSTGIEIEKGAGGAAGALYIDSSGNVGIGTTAPAGKLHIQSGDAGTVTPSSQADDLVVEASTEGGITIMTPDAQSARIRFTSPSTESGDVGGADIFYRQNINKMSIGTTVSGGKLAFKSGASVETMVLDGGNVGIGTTAPAALLHLKSTANAAGPSLIFENTNNAQSMNIDFWNNGGAVQSRIQYAEGPASFNFIPNTSNNNSALYIAYDGKVGIGTASPKARVHIGTLIGGNNTAQEQLRLSGDYTATNSGALLRFTNQHDSGTNPNAGEYNLAGIKAFDFRSDWGGAIALQTAPNTSTGGTLVDRLVINPEGNVGIGNTDPGAMWQGANSLVIGDGTNSSEGMTFYPTATGNSMIAFANTNAAGGAGKYDGYISYSQSTHRMTFSTNMAGTNNATSYDLMIDGDGVVMMGGFTVDPATGNGNQKGFSYRPNLGRVEISSTSENSVLELNRYSGDGDMQVFSLAGAEFGSIGINNTRFTIEGPDNPVRITTGTSNIQINHDTHITFDTANAERMRITSAGKVAIGSGGAGTSGTHTKLEVHGAIAAGSAQGTGGSLVLYQRYGVNDMPATLSTHYSNSYWLLATGMKARSGASGYVSSLGNYSTAKAGIEINNSSINYLYVPAATHAVDTVLTPRSPFYMNLDTGELQLRTTTNSLRGYISAQETNSNGTHSPGLVIATSGGEAITFKDGGTAGTTNMVITGNGVVSAPIASTHGGQLHGAVTPNPSASYLGSNGADFGTIAIYRTPVITSSSTVAATSQFLSIYSSGHWSEYPVFRFKVYGTYYVGGYREYIGHMTATSASLNAVETHGTSTFLGGGGNNTITMSNVVSSGLAAHSGQPRHRRDFTLTNHGNYGRCYVVVEIMYGGNKYYGSSTSTSTLDALGSSGGSYHFKTMSTAQGQGTFST